MQKFASPHACRMYWFQQVSAWQKSGLSQAEFARQRHISIKSLSYWIRRDRKTRLPEQNADQGKKEISGPVKSGSAGFIALPVQIALRPQQTPPAGQLTLRIGAEYRITIPSDFCSETLEKVVRTLRQLS